MKIKVKTKNMKHFQSHEDELKNIEERNNDYDKNYSLSGYGKNDDYDKNFSVNYGKKKDTHEPIIKHFKDE